MKVFLSWSGPTSREVASALHDWLPYFIQIVRPFMSAEDIEKGSYWGEALKSQMKIPYGIICLTKGNSKQPWINFEAGAISKAIGDKSRVLPFLFRVNPSEIRGPLAQFQSTKYDESGEDFFRLLQALNDAIRAEQQVPHDVLRKGFETWWPTLKARLDKIEDTSPPNELPWLYSTCDLVDVMVGNQPDAEDMCNWVITPFIFRNVRKPDVESAIEKNIERGISYVFLIPRNDKVGEAKRSLQKFAPPESGKVKVWPIDKKTFSSLAVTDCVIQSPHSNSARAFLELPINGERGYWIAVNEQATQGFVSRFGKLISDAEKAEATRRGGKPRKTRNLESGKTRSNRSEPGKNRARK